MRQAGAWDAVETDGPLNLGGESAPAKGFRANSVKNDRGRTPLCFLVSRPLQPPPIPAKAGIHGNVTGPRPVPRVPAFAGMSGGVGRR